MACLDENALTGFLQGVLSQEEAERVERHVDQCADCRTLLSALSRLSLDRTITRVTEPSPDSAAAAPEPGQVVAGKYSVDRVIGAGGMGVVVAATHLELNQVVALKFMQPSALANGEASARFLREARAVARLKSEHVGRVLDLGRLDSGAPYIVMEHLDGQDLDRLVATKGPLPVDVATDYLLQALEAVAEAHAVGIVHRDLKPANLFLTHAPGGTPCVKVLDFGVSKSFGPETAASLGRTDARAVVGSPLYMAPEQLVSAGTVDPRADIWSLGCTLYQLVSGRTPFEGDSLPRLTANILKSPPRSLRVDRPEIPAGFEEVVGRCLAKEPSQRFRDVADLAEALVPFAPSGAREQVVRIGTVLGVGLGVEPDRDDAPARKRSRLWTPRAIAAVSLATALVASAIYAFAGREGPSPRGQTGKRVDIQRAAQASSGSPAAPSPADATSTREPPRTTTVESAVATAPTSTVPAPPTRAHAPHASGSRRTAGKTGRAPSPAEASDDVFGTRK